MPNMDAIEQYQKAFKAAQKEYKELLAETVAQSKSNRKYPVLLTGLSDGARCVFDIALSQDFKSKTGGKTLLIVPDEAAGYLAEKIFTENTIAVRIINTIT